MWNHVAIGPRQCGKSTIAAIYALWRVLRQPNITVVLFTPKFALGEELLSIIANLRINLGAGPDFVKRNKEYLEFSNKSRIKLATGITHLIGVSCDLLIFDEAAFISDPDHVMYAALPVYLSSNNTQIIFLSTPRGYDNYLYEIYIKACKGENSFIATRMNADDLPHRAKQIKLWTGSKDAFYEREIEGRFYGYGK